MKFQFLGLLGFIFSIGVATAQAREVYLNCDDDRGDEVMFAVTPNSQVHSGYIAYLPRDERHTGSIDRATLGQATAEMWQAVGQVAFTIYSGRPGSMFYDPNRTAVRFDEGLLIGAASHGEGVLIQRRYGSYPRTERALNCDVVNKPADYRFLFLGL